MSIRYAPGPAFALVRPGLVVVVDSTVSVRTVARLWDALETVAPSDGMAVVLDAVTSVLDPTWRALPAFSIVALTPSVTGDGPVAAHVASRGELAVQLRTPEGDVSVAGRGVTTWVENQFVDVHTITLGPGGDDAEDDVLTIVDGVVGVGALTWQVAPGGVTVTVGDEPSEAVPVGDERPVEPGAEPEPEREAEPAALPGSEPAVSLEAEPQPERAVADESAPALEPVASHEPVPVPVVDLQPEPQPEVPPDPAPEPDPEPDREPEPEPIDAGGLPEAELRELEFGRTLAEFPEDWRPGDADVSEPTPESDGAPVGRRLLHDQADAPERDEPLVAVSEPSVAPGEQDAAREDPGTERTLTADDADDPDEDLDDSTILSTAGSAVPVPVPSRTVSVAPSAVAPPPPASPGLPPVPPPPPPPPSTDSGYGYGPSTQSQPTLQQASYPSAPSGVGGYGVVAPQPQVQAASVAPPVSAPTGPPPKAPEILARSCFFGHANPPVRMTCSQCGGGLSPNAQLVERPSLGRVRFSHGEVVELVQPVVVGRFPMPQSQQGMAPRLVTVVSPSQDVSRSHLEIRLEGWHVLLVDLDTVNGTTLRRAGQAPRRLHPHEPTLITEGDVVDLGDGVLLTFEGIA